MKTVQRLCAVFLLTASCCSSMSRAEVTLTCDLQDFTHRLECSDGGVIAVQNVSVSHREAEACVDGIPPDRLEAPLCSAAPVLDIIKTRCNGQSRCSVNMDLCHAAKPCRTRCVWVETVFTCEVGRVHHVCQKEKARLHCGSQVIKVLMANYGRTSEKVCKYSAPRRQPPSTSCRSSTSLQVMADRCDGRHRCSVRASNQIFSNSCPGTQKYLQFSFTCERPGN